MGAVEVFFARISLVVVSPTRGKVVSTNVVSHHAKFSVAVAVAVADVGMVSSRVFVYSQIGSHPGTM